MYIYIYIYTHVCIHACMHTNKMLHLFLPVISKWFNQPSCVYLCMISLRLTRMWFGLESGSQSNVILYFEARPTINSCVFAMRIYHIDNHRHIDAQVPLCDQWGPDKPENFEGLSMLCQKCQSLCVMAVPPVLPGVSERVFIYII